jgi:3-hydroxybutyryl-CoA dehydrogenase
MGPTEAIMVVRSLAIIGAGTMGAGIAQVAAEAGYEVRLGDVGEDFLEKALGTIRKFVGRKVEKGEISQGVSEEILSRIKPTTDLTAAVAGADLILEAIPENIEMKRNLFRKLGSRTPPETILASNTSTLSITEIGAATNRAQKVVGMHFFNPAPVMKLVEVVKGEKTSEETVEIASGVCQRMGKTPIVVKDIPGFIVNRFLGLLYNEAANLVYRGVASPEDIDTAMRLGANHPMGPLQIADLAGVDVVLAALEAVYAATKEERYKPCPLFAEMVKQGKLGRKTGEGFYHYQR